MPRKSIMREFRINEISGVDNPAQEGARVAIMKRAEPPGEKRRIGKDVGGLADLLTSEQEGHQHGVSVSSRGGEIVYYVSYASGPNDVDGHSHPLARLDGGYVLGVVAGHTHTIEQEAMSGSVIALVTKGKGEETMTEKTETQPTVEELQAQLARTHAVVALNTRERGHFDALPEDARTAFLAKSADGRQAEMDSVAKAKEDTDPVVYTTADGVELRKSAGEAFIALAKSNDALRKEAETLRAEREQELLEKRAETELPHLPGDVKTLAAMLKAIDGIEEQAQREAAHSALRAQNEALAKAFGTYGHAGEPPPGSPDDQLDKLAKAHAKEHSVSDAVAYAEVLGSAEGRALYAKTVNQEVK